LVEIEYDIISSIEGKIPLKLFPIHPNYAYFDESEGYFLSFIQEADYRKKNSHEWKPGTRP